LLKIDGEIYVTPRGFQCGSYPANPPVIGKLRMPPCLGPVTAGVVGVVGVVGVGVVGVGVVGVGVVGVEAGSSSPPQAINVTDDITSTTDNKINSTLFFIASSP